MIGDFAGHSYQYDAENNLISIDNGSTATFGYSVLNERDKVATASGTLMTIPFMQWSWQNGKCGEMPARS